MPPEEELREMLAFADVVKDIYKAADVNAESKTIINTEMWREAASVLRETPIIVAKAIEHDRRTRRAEKAGIVDNELASVTLLAASMARLLITLKEKKK